jgi:hypothetical protein
VTDLRPYLEAALHLAVVKDDLSVFQHEHGTAGGPWPAGGDHGADSHAGHAGHESMPAAFGPEVTTTFTVPEPGTYYLFAQAAHGEDLVVSRIPVQVR